MTNEEAKRKVRGYLTDILPTNCSDEIDEIMQALEPKWIPVSERLPEEDGEYYVTILNHLPNISNKKSVRILDFWVDGIDYHGATFHWGFYSGFSTSAIIAWMPLPSSYKEDAE